MRKLLSCFVALCLMVIPAFALADDAVTNYMWSTDNQFDLYDLGFSITLPEGWTHADEATIAAMNGETVDGEPLPDATTEPSNSALTPYAIATISNTDGSVSTVISCEDVEDPNAITNADQYLELLANDIVSSSSADGVTYTYDITTISDATLCTQTFRELAVTGSDGSIIDLLVCHSGIGSYYSFVIMGSGESITAFASDFVSSISEIEAVG
jgi:hypothetical protein